MKFSVETLARLYAAGRNYANLVIGFSASIGLLSISQQKTLMQSLGEVYQGIALMVHGFSSIWQVLVVVGGPFVGAVLAWYAQRSAKTPNQAAAVQAAVVDPNTPISPDVKATIIATAKAV